MASIKNLPLDFIIYAYKEVLSKHGIINHYVDLHLPYETADNYLYYKTSKKIDGFIYLDEQWCKKIYEPTTSYLLGPKGSGKTMFAAYMCAKKRENTISNMYSLNVNDYGKLIKMKADKHLDYTDYMTMWEVILLEKFISGISKKEIIWGKRKKQITHLIDSIKKYKTYQITEDSFNPSTESGSAERQTEITEYLEGKATLEIGNEKIKASSSVNANSTERSQHVTNSKNEHSANVYIDTWLESIHRIAQIIENVSFKTNHFLFVDGLDVRPNNIDTTEYGECIGALIRAVYDINRNIFGSMKKKRELKIIALTRTDIFLNSRIINSANLVHDNCIEFDWTKNVDNDIQNSYLYKMMNRILGWKMKETNRPFYLNRNMFSTISMFIEISNRVFGWNEKDTNKPFDYYFNFSVKNRYNEIVDPAKYIMSLSRLRPRDIVVFFNRIKNECMRQDIKDPNPTIIESASFRKEYSSYYDDQITSEMEFRYTKEEVDTILSLTKIIDRRYFTEKTFETLINNDKEKVEQLHSLFSNHRDLLDVLYSLNIIGWREDIEDAHEHWCYKDSRTSAEDMKLPWTSVFKKSNVIFIVHECVGDKIISVT